MDAMVTRVELVRGDGRKLMRFDANGKPNLFDPDKGSWPKLLRALQDSYKRIGGREFVTVTAEDMRRIDRWWDKGAKGRPGRGGWQKCTPTRSLAPFLTTLGPICRMIDGLSAEEPTQRNSGGYYFYVKHLAGRDLVKIGRGNAQRARRRSDTGSPYTYVDLVVLQFETELESVEFERALKARWKAHHYCTERRDEIYMLHPSIKTWCDRECEKQGGVLPPRLKRSR